MSPVRPANGVKTDYNRRNIQPSSTLVDQLPMMPRIQLYDWLSLDLALSKCCVTSSACSLAIGRWWCHKQSTSRCDERVRSSKFSIRYQTEHFCYMYLIRDAQSYVHRGFNSLLVFTRYTTYLLCQNTIIKLNYQIPLEGVYDVSETNGLA